MSDKFELLSNFNPDANYKLVRIGSDSPVLEVELNEMQDIAEHRYKSFISNYIGDGIVCKGTYVYNNTVLVIENESAIVKGNVIDITKLTCTIKEGEKAYLKVWEETVGFETKIPYKGNKQETREVINTILDPRVNQETSRRVQVLYDLVTSTSLEGDYLEVGTVIDGEFIVTSDIKGYHGKVTCETYTSKFDQHLLTLQGKYKVGTNALQVFVDGNIQVVNQDYIEVNTSTIRFIDCLKEGQDIVIFVQNLAKVHTNANSHSHEHELGGEDVLDIIDLADRDKIIERIKSRLDLREINGGNFSDMYVPEEDEVYDGGYF